MSPEELTTLFAEASEVFPAIVGQPTDMHLYDLREILLPLLLDVPYDAEWGTHSLVGLITDDAEYVADYGSSFVRPTRLGAYDNTLDADVKNVERARAEAKWNARKDDWGLYEVAKKCARRFIISKVEDTWIRELKDARHFYTRVTAKELLDHLQASCLGTHAIDALGLQIAMKEFHHQAEGIPEYINLLEDAQRTAIRIDKNNPITNASVLVIATTAMIADGRFPRTTEEWEDLPATDKTWKKWKTMYKAAQGKERVRAKAAGGSDSFGGNNEGGANAVLAGTNAVGADAAAGDHCNNTNGGAFSVAELESCFDNLANAAKAERATIDELVQNNSVLTTTNSDLVASNKKLGNEKTQLQHEINALRKRGGEPRASSGRGKPRPCKHCKGDHKDNECLELPQNASKRGADWKSTL